MKKEGLFVILFFLINISAVGASDEILLKSRRFIPAAGITAAAKTKIEAIPQRAHVLIQLERIPTIKERKELEAEGIRLLSYIPNKAWFASIPSSQTSEIAALPNIRAISEILPEDKISPHIRAGEFFWERVKDGKADFIVEFFKDVSLEEAELVIEKYKGSIVGRVPTLNALVITAQIEESIDLGFEEAVKWVEQELPLEELNDGVRAAIGVDTVQDPPYNLNGTDVDVLVYDSGLVDYTHDDFGSRVTLGEPGSTSDHSTHVAGTVGGDGTLSNGTYRGMAPAVDIISYYVSGTCVWGGTDNRCLYDDSGQMADMNDNFNEGITTYGADIGTASVGCQPCQWGISCEYEGDYCLYARLIDTIIYNRSIPIIWAAGNERNPGFPCWRECGDYGTISPTSTGKNAIIVGATNSNDDSMTDFSSWGPTDDGRIKPDVVAPGCQEGGDWGITSTIPGSTYDSYCGTSMATPAVSGSVALMLEDWRDTHTGEPLPSTMKAILIETAKDLGNTGPDYSHGYGLINVKDAVDLIDSDNANNDVILEESIIEQNDKDYFTVDVPQGQSELKITLVWDDYPGDPAADKALVNDLDLIVKAPGGTRHFPWTLDPVNPASPAVRNQEDHINNVEQVYVNNPASGTWLIEINGNNVPEPVQNYSLVSNDLSLLVEKSYLLNKVDDVNDGNSVLPDDEITYTIYYANPDPNDPNYIGPLTDVNIVDHLPVEVDYTNPFDPNYNSVLRTYTWNIGTLSPGDSNHVSLTVTVNNLAEPLGTITNLCVLEVNEIQSVIATEITDVNCWNPGVIYVDKYATGSNTGMSWHHAYTDLQDALERAAHYGSEIWVAEGTYKPAEVVDWSATFKLVDGVAMYGGFPHGGGWRNWVTNETILSGDIDNDGSSDVQDVVTALNVSQTTIIDGFTITKGDWSGIWCDVNSSPTIAHNTIKENNYDGIDCNDNSGSTIIDCTIEDNGRYGICCLPNSSPTITRSRIQNNGDDGIYYENSDPNIINCIIEENSDNGIYSEHSLPATITNNIIRGNNSDGIYCQEIGEGIEIHIKNNWIHNNYNGIHIHNELVAPAPAEIRNNTIANNAGYGINSFWAVDANVTNCIIWNNTSGQFYSDNGTFNVTYSCIHGGGTSNGNINSDPCFVDDANDNYHLRYDSNCIDKGDPNFDPDPNETDIDGEPRIVNGRVDMGADEYYWSPADFNENEIVNFVDYAMFANFWQTDNPDFSLDGDNDVDMNDLALFCEDWLWQAGWAKTFAAGYGQSMGRGFGLMEGLYPSAPAEQQPTQIEPLDIEEIIKWLEELWLTDELVRKMISEDEWLKFIESVKNSK